jgi:short-subunit dehydrogenase
MHVIITGGSSGIGLEVARIYLSRGANVSLIARDPERLEKARQSLLSQAAPRRTGARNLRIHTASADTSDADRLEAAVADCLSANGPCDILIASAGIVEPSAFDEQESSVFEAQISTNVFGTVNAVRAVYADMKRRGAGRIMIVSSGAALIGIHGYTAYCASKSALAGFAEALRGEAGEHGVAVSVCFPPDTLTPQFQAELPKRSPQARKLMGAAPPWPATKVAERIVQGVEKRAAKVYFGFEITALGLFGPLVKPLVFWWYGRT